MSEEVITAQNAAERKEQYVATAREQRRRAGVEEGEKRWEYFAFVFQDGLAVANFINSSPAQGAGEAMVTVHTETQRCSLFIYW